MNNNTHKVIVLAKEKEKKGINNKASSSFVFLIRAGYKFIVLLL